MVDIDTEALKAAAPIIPFIKGYYDKKLPIVRFNGNTAFCNCIFHEENTGSLAFFPNGTYKCFGCGAHGDVITLVQKIENLSFQEACQFIGEKVGYEVILEPPNPEHERYKDTMDGHTRRYWNNLHNDGEAMRYLLLQRGLSEEIIQRFRLGLTDRDEYKYRKDLGDISHKIAFPILEHKKRNPKCIAMAYRVIGDGVPKYINDKNKDGVFIKGETLYGYPLAYDSIKQAGHVIVVEGYFDVISMHQSGLCNTVATMGTAFTEKQATELYKITRNVLLFYDGDKAGKTSMLKNLSILYKTGFNVAVCIMDTPIDPDELCKAYQYDGQKIWRKMQECIRQGMEVVIEQATMRYADMASKERRKAIEAASPIINEIQDPYIKEMYMKTLYKRLDL